VRIRVLIADDQRIVRDGLAMIVGMLDGVEVVGTAEDGEQAVRLAGELAPDVVLMDLRMPVLDGVEATRALAPEVAVLVLTTFADDDSLLPALRAGARGYLTKDAGGEEIERAIRALHAGQTHLDPAIQRRLIELATEPATASPARPPSNGEDDLTAREAEVLTLIAAGLSNAEIAAELVVSGATIKTHVNRIFAKTGVRDRAQLVAHAYRAGLVRP
jgi:DNA-binding NarL/FixJ family response regulator